MKGKKLLKCGLSIVNREKSRKCTHVQELQKCHKFECIKSKFCYY